MDSQAKGKGHEDGLAEAPPFQDYSSDDRKTLNRTPSSKQQIGLNPL